MYEFFYIKDYCNIFCGWIFCYGNVFWVFFLCVYFGWFWIDEVFFKIYGEIIWDKVSIINLKFLFNGIGFDFWLIVIIFKMLFEWL